MTQVTSERVFCPTLICDDGGRKVKLGMPSAKYEQRKKLGQEAVAKGFCKACFKSPIWKIHSNNYCEHCFTNRKKGNLKHRISHPKPKSIRILKTAEEKKESDALYRKKNKAVLNLRSRLWQRDNPERVKTNKDRWLKENPLKPIEYVHARRAKEQKALGIFTSDEWKSLQDFYGHICLWCEKSSNKLSPDHVIPLAKGGTNYITNIQPLCPSCNSKKNTKILDFRPFGNAIMDWT